MDASLVGDPPSTLVDMSVPRTHRVALYISRDKRSEKLGKVAWRRHPSPWKCPVSLDCAVMSGEFSHVVVGRPGPEPPLAVAGVLAEWREPRRS